MTTRRFLLAAPVIAQCAALAVQVTLPMPYGFYAQLASLVIMLVVGGALGAERLRTLRHRYREIRRAREARREAFRTFVAANLPGPPR